MKLYLLTAILFFTACTSNGQKGAEIYQKNGAAIGGYDAVAFFTESKPVKGTADYSYQWKDATWKFASQQNLDSFAASPEKYAPQYGGYCAYGTADGHKAPTEVDTWTVLDGKLYFNYNQKLKACGIRTAPNTLNKPIRIGKRSSSNKHRIYFN
jgi:YHS domain-containing protein